MNEVKLLFAITFIWLGDAANAFICQEKGIFANTDSDDCKTFINCDSNLYPQVNYCSENTYFWPTKKGCFVDYDCATDLAAGNTNLCDGFYSNENISDHYSPDCTNFLVCSSMKFAYDDGDEIDVPQVYRSECRSGTAFRPEYGCVSDYQCADFQCSAIGLFENPNVNDCSSFVKCAKYISYAGGTGSLLYNYLKTCPSNTKFSPFSKKCDEFYHCDGVDPHAGGDPCLNYNNANPFVPNPHDTAGSTYIECQQGTYDKRMDVIVKKECPANTFFSPNIGKCYYNYDISEICSKDPCRNGAGAFVDYESKNCKRFIDCRDDSLTLESYRPSYVKRFCPPGSRFAPEIANCDPNYVCPTHPVDYCYPEIPTTTTSTTASP